MSSFESWEPLAIVAIFFFLTWSVGVRIALVLDQIRQAGNSERVVIALLKRAADKMSHQTPEQEATEVAYLLDAVGHRLDKETYCRVLEHVQARITADLQAARVGL